MKQSNNKKSRDVTAFLYERLSRDDNLEGESYSIGNQKKLLAKVAKEKGYTNLVHFLDDGISGVTMDRPGFNDMMEQLAAGKAAAVFLRPLLLLAAHYLVLFLVFRDAKNRNQSKKVVGLLFWMIPAVSILVSGITYAVALGWNFRLAGLLFAGLGLMFAAIGNYLPKCRPNRTVGIRISWTLGSEENWIATHRFAGKVWVIGGLIMVLAALLPEVPRIIVTVLAVAALSILPIAYSYRYHRIHGAKSEPDPLSKKLSAGVLIFTAVIVVFVAVMLFTGNLHYRFDSDSFTVEASYFDDLTVKYDAIDGIEYREGNVDGTRTFGVGSFRLLLGTFENAEFGTYTRYTYYRPEACVILSVSGKTLVLSGDSTESTRNLYDTLITRTGL